MKTLQILYQEGLDSGDLEPDPAQAAAVERLDELHRRLVAADARPRYMPGRGFGGLFRRRYASPAPEKGLYIWGSVGRGKTWLVDLFFSHLPIEEKRRVHFHQFMREIHDKLAGLKERANPLRGIASNLARETRVLCLDEFIVSDIGDAMILAQLLDGLVAEGVTLVTTSNTPPHRLYQDGIQRASFLPAIELLKRHTEVIELYGTTDYRLRVLEQATVYHTPIDPSVEESLVREFARLAPDTVHAGGTIRIFGREIPVIQTADDVIWFDFMALCGPPRSQADYLELARRYHTVFISDIPVLGPSLDDATRRFLYLLDEFYDRNVKLVLSAAARPESLYQGERLAFDFQRAASRLREMQSTDYLAREHRP